jgi:hypothetical protein
MISMFVVVRAQNQRRIKSEVGYEYLQSNLKRSADFKKLRAPRQTSLRKKDSD